MRYYAGHYNIMGLNFYKWGKFEEAIGAYNRALSLLRDYAWYNNIMGIALNNQGKLEEAIGSYKKTK